MSKATKLIVLAGAVAALAAPVAQADAMRPHPYGSTDALRPHPYKSDDAMRPHPWKDGSLRRHFRLAASVTWNRLGY